MSTKLRLSKEKTEHLTHISNKLNLRWNIVLRLAIGRSLAEKDSVKEFEHTDNLGKEFNWATVIGNHGALFKALVMQHEGRRLNEFEFYSHYLKNHIERGIGLLTSEYERINSPIEFLLGLIDFNIREKQSLDLFRK